MADPLRWSFELRDRMSGPAKSISRELGKVNSELRKGQRMSSSLYDRAGVDRAAYSIRGVASGARASSTNLASAGLNGLAAAAAALGLATAARMALSVTLDLAAAAANVARRFAEAVVEAGMFRATASFGLERILGSPSQAREALSTARELSEFLGTDLHETVSSLQTLMAQGFGARESRTFFQAMQDLKTVNPAASIEGLTLAVAQIRSAGQLRGQELLQLTNAGLNRGELLSNIGNQLGVRGGSQADIVRRVQGLMQSGRVSSDVALRGILDTIQGQTGRAIGGVTSEFSQTLPGLFARLQQFPARFFDAVAEGSDSAFGSMRELLLQINALLDPQSAQFHSLVTILSEGFGVIIELLRTAWEVGRAFFEGLFGEITHGDDPTQSLKDGLASVRETLVGLRSSGTLETVRSFARGLVQFGRAVWPVVRGLLIFVGVVALVGGVLMAAAIAFFGFIPALLTVIVGALTDLIARVVVGIGDLFEPIANFAVTAYQWGVSLVQGLINGITSMLAPLRQTADTLGTTVTSAVTDVLGIRSPSRVMAELGRYTVAGFEQGLGDGPDLGLAVPGAASLAGGAGRGGVQVGTLLHIEVHGGGDEQVAEQIRSSILPELERAFEQLATEAGLA